MYRWFCFALIITALLAPVQMINADYEVDGAATVDLPSLGNPLVLDSVLATDPESITATENLFLGLTDVDPLTGDIVPELATYWIVNNDGLTWIFNLRDDVYWVRYDPYAEMARIVRRVVADDLVYTIKRICDPRNEEYREATLIRVVAGCDILRHQTQVTDKTVYGDIVQVTAPDDTTLVIRLQYPAQFFLALTPTIRPMPVETVETYGSAWTEQENIITNGAFMIGLDRTFFRNPYFPKQLHYGGNIERVRYHVIEDSGTRLALYDENEIDQTNVDGIYLEGVLNNPDYFRQVVRVFDLHVYYFGFSHDMPPFDDVHVRRAFGAILDRQRFIEELRWGRGIPMTTFTPTDVLLVDGAEGVDFDPAFARGELAKAGYPHCQGLPPLHINVMPHTEGWAAFLAAAAEQYLGCGPGTITIHNNPIELPHVWTEVWRPTYRDPHHWLGDLLACNVNGSLSRGCSGIDGLLQTAAQQPLADIRLQLYAEIERAFFGAEGEYPIIPLFLEGGTFYLIKPWYTGPFTTDGQFGGHHWDAYSIDSDRKNAA